MPMKLKMTRAETVAKIRQLIREKGRINWEIGDLVLDQIPEDHHNSELANLASDVGVEFDTLAERRLVSQRTPTHMRVTGVSWSVYKEIAAQSDPAKRTELQQYVLDTPVPEGYRSWTVSLMREKVGRRPMLHTAEPLLPHVLASSLEEKVQAAEALLADPSVAETVMDTGTALGQRAFALSVEHNRRLLEETRQREQDTEQRDNADPLIRKLNQMQAIQDLTGVYADAATKAKVLLSMIRSLPGPSDDALADRVFLTDSIDRLKVTITATEALLAGNANAVDAFFAAVVKEARG